MTGETLDELAADGSSTRLGAALAPVGAEIAELGDFLRAETAAGRGYLPGGDTSARVRRRRSTTCGC